MAVFGIYLMPIHEAAGCPFMLGETALCPTPLTEHIGYWQAAFAATLVGLLALCAGFLLAIRECLDLYRETVRQRFRVRGRNSARPTLFQELYAQGILNRRAP